MPQILARVSKLPVAFASSGDTIADGRVYIAPPDLQLIITKSRLALVHGPRENGFRPAVDALFRTAAREFGPRVIGVILSGGLSDGTFGLSLIKSHGGVTIVQDPKDALIDSMPRAAMNAVDVDYILPAKEIAPTLELLCLTSSERGAPAMGRKKGDLEPQLVSQDTEVSEMEEHFGDPSPFTCPDCGGTLWEIKDGRAVRYQCHVGHQYAGDGLETAQRESIDSAMWSAVRALEEHAELKLRLAKRAEAGGMSAVANGFEEGARVAHQQAQQIRGVLFSAASTAGDEAAAVQVQQASALNPNVANATRGKTKARRTRKPSPKNRR
jgi:two-component system chemotaxis response regulator CheB